MFFTSDFESEDWSEPYLEVRGLDDGRARRVTDSSLVHTGGGAVQFTAPANDGQESGAGCTLYFGPTGNDVVYFRRYIRFASRGGGQHHGHHYQQVPVCRHGHGRHKPTASCGPAEHWTHLAPARPLTAAPP